MNMVDQAYDGEIEDIVTNICGEGVLSDGSESFDYSALAQKVIDENEKTVNKIMK